jgi:hypothetical protein
MAPDIPKSKSTYLSVHEMQILSNAIEKSIAQKIYNREEIIALFPVYNKIKGLCEGIIRKNQVEDMYKEILADKNDG